MPASLGVYPFVDGKVEDFDPIFEELVRTMSFEIGKFAELIFCRSSAPETMQAFATTLMLMLSPSYPWERIWLNRVKRQRRTAIQRKRKSFISELGQCLESPDFLSIVPN